MTVPNTNCARCDEIEPCDCACHQKGYEHLADTKHHSYDVMPIEMLK